MARSSRSSGPNGVGKTTLAQIAAGLLEPAAGEAIAAACPPTSSQDPGRHLVTERVIDEVALGADEARARAALAKLGLAALADRHPRDLSAGERERLSLAAVLATEPDFLVLDEPTRGVDPERKVELAQLAPVRGGPARHARRHPRSAVGGRGRGPGRGAPRAGGRPCVG